MNKHDDRTILVTGATGTVGSEVVKQLASSGQRGQSAIRAAVHSQNKADKFKSDNKTVEIVNIDYNKPETIADALDHVDTLFLVTLPTPNMANISSSMVKEAKKNGVKYIVKLSVMKADAEPGFTVGRLHRQEEKIIEESGIPYRLWRPPLGPGEWRSIGLFRAADEAELREVLASMPLHIWMKVTITPLTPHPNDPEYRTSQAMDHPQA
jgi:uncharacterized protein YbjT (DUF2867 family)